MVKTFPKRRSWITTSRIWAAVDLIMIRLPVQPCLIRIEVEGGSTEPIFLFFLTGFGFVGWVYGVFGIIGLKFYNIGIFLSIF